MIQAQLNKAGEAVRFAVQCNVAQLNSIALDPTVFTKEGRHKWKLISTRFESSGAEPNTKTMAGETTLHVDAQAKQVNLQRLLSRKGWEVNDLCRMRPSPLPRTKREPASIERLQALLAGLTRLIGGKEAANFGVAWWFSLVRASRR